MSNQGEIRSILFIIAMESEARPLLTRLGLEQIDISVPSSPCKIYSGEYKSVKVSVVTNGKCGRYGVDNVGTTPATLAAFIAINQVKPDIVINAGTAGGFKRKGGHIGDSYISTGFKYHDRRILPIPWFRDYGVGNYSSLAVPNLIKDLGLKEGIVTTSNSLDHNETDDILMLENDASVKEMEAAAIAWTAQLSNTPFFALKVVTDIVDGDRPTQEELMENLHTAVVSLQATIIKLLDYMIDKKITEL